MRGFLATIFFGLVLVGCADEELAQERALNTKIRTELVQLQKEVEQQAALATEAASHARRAEQLSQQAQESAEEQVRLAREKIAVLEQQLKQCK